MTTLALLVWPLVILVLAARLPLPTLVLVGLIGGYLFLPTRAGWDFPLLPRLNKDSIPALVVLLLAVLMCRSSAQTGSKKADPDGLNRPGWIPSSSAALIPLTLIIVGAFITVATNRDPLIYGPVRIPNLRLYDAFSMTLAALMTLLPVFLGRKLFAHPDRQHLLLKVLVVFALGYSLLTLFEIRMSPQLNHLVYGFFPHDWLQHIRSGGFRPVVFLSHGLALAIFLAMAVLAAFGLARCEQSSRKRLYFAAGGWLLLTLALANSLGALLIALMLVPVVILLGTRLQIMIAAMLAVTALTYPILRSMDVIPTEQIVSIVREDISHSRSYSLEYRFLQEDQQLAHASERPLAGWGTFGRSRVFDELGRDVSTTDGMWIVTFAQRGWIGYLGFYGLLCLPIILLIFRNRGTGLEPETAVLALVLSAQLIDTIPNGFVSPISWLITGALLGRLEFRQATAAQQAEPVAEPTRGGQVYARPATVAAEKKSASATPSIRDHSGQTYSRQTVLHRRAEKQGG
jgi:hypothetical protein